MTGQGAFTKSAFPASVQPSEDFDRTRNTAPVLMELEMFSGSALTEKRSDNSVVMLRTPSAPLRNVTGLALHDLAGDLLWPF